jgi:hypothetical protein
MRKSLKTTLRDIEEMTQRLRVQIADTEIKIDRVAIDKELFKIEKEAQMGLMKIHVEAIDA